MLFLILYYVGYILAVFILLIMFLEGVKNLRGSIKYKTRFWNQPFIIIEGGFFLWFIVAVVFMKAAKHLSS